MDVLALIGAALADAAFAFVACIGFALISNPPVKICLVAGVLAGLGQVDGIDQHRLEGVDVLVVRG